MAALSLAERCRTAPVRVLPLYATHSFRLLPSRAPMIALSLAERCRTAPVRVLPLYARDSCPILCPLGPMAALSLAEGCRTAPVRVLPLYARHSCRPRHSRAPMAALSLAERCRTAPWTLESRTVRRASPARAFAPRDTAQDGRSACGMRDDIKCFLLAGRPRSEQMWPRRPRLGDHSRGRLSHKCYQGYGTASRTAAIHTARHGAVVTGVALPAGRGSGPCGRRWGTRRRSRCGRASRPSGR